MKKTFMLFLSPLLGIICTLFSWLMKTGIIILPIWLFRDLCVPILHFSIVSHYLKNGKSNNIKNILTIVLSVLLLMATIIIEFVLFSYNSRLVVPHIVFNIVWATFCGIVIIAHTTVHRCSANKTSFRIIIIVEAIIALSNNALLSYILSPLLASNFAVDGIEIVLLSASAIILSMYSYLLGHTMTKRYIIAKMLLWLFGILTSEFVALWLLGVPHTPPTENIIALFIWLITSLIVFTWCILGSAKHYIHRIILKVWPIISNTKN